MCKSAKMKSTKTTNYSQKLANFKKQSNGDNYLTIQPLISKDEAFQEALPAHITSTPEMQELANIISKVCNHY